MSEENWAARLCRAVDEKLGGNWSELARRADLTPSTLQQAKEGGDVRLSTLNKIAEALGMTVGELLDEPGFRVGEEPGLYNKKDEMGVGALSRDEGALVKKYLEPAQLRIDPVTGYVEGLITVGDLPIILTMTE